MFSRKQDCGGKIDVVFGSELALELAVVEVLSLHGAT